MKYSAVVFDMDGTLVNTIPDIVSVVNLVLRKRGLAEKSESAVRNGVGFGVEHLLETLDVPENLRADMVVEIDRAYTEMKDSRAFVYRGIRRMIERVSQAGIPMFILSNKLQKSLEKSVSDYLSFAEFVSVTGSQPGKPAKPSPNLLLEVLGKNGISPDSVVIVGDGEADVEVAQAAGISCLSVLWGFRTRNVLAASGAEMFAATPEDAADLILSGEQ